MKQHDVSAYFKQQPLFKLSPIALVIASLGLAFQPVALAAQTQKNQITSAVANKSQQYNIQAGPLSQVLSEFAGKAGIALSFNAADFNNIKSSGLRGSYSLEQGFIKLLSATRYTVEKQKSGSYVLVKKSTRIGTLATAVIESEDLKDGSAEDGYRVDEISAVGPWQGRTLQETPYSINVVSESLIKNLQATSPDQVYKMNPVIQLNLPQTMNDNAVPTTRGFLHSGVAHNGISREKWNSHHASVMEETAQIEVLTGLSGFFYGADNIGGTVNYVSKRPTVERINNITFGNTSGKNIYLHGDFGGQFDEDGTFGYRLNVVTQDGDTHVDNQSLKRNSIGLVVDWQVNNDLLIEVNVSKRDYLLDGRQALWFLGDIDSRPEAKQIDSNKLWSQKWAKQEHNSHRLGASIDWTINENIRWRSAYETEDTGLKGYFTGNTLQSDTSYDQQMRKSSPASMISSGGFSYLDISFDTADIAHTITTGWRFSKSHMLEYERNESVRVFSSDLSLESPTYVSEPDWGTPDTGTQIDKMKLASHNYIIGDDIKFNKQWSALVGLSLVEVSISNYWRDDYKESAVTPNLSLIYQPLDNITTYASYSEGFEIGGTAADYHKSAKNNVINAGEVMKPLTSSQIEFGAKIDMNGMLLTAALFEIDKGLEYYNAVNDKQYEFVQDGRQVHRGLEFTATGKLTENLTLVGGFTLLDAQTKDNKSNVELEGKRPVDVAKQMFKLYGEYNITAIPGLVINGGFSHTGSFYGDEMNTDLIDSYTLVDIGARYNLALANKDVTLRLNINNLTDEQYWVMGWYLGDRRTVSASVSVAF